MYSQPPSSSPPSPSSPPRLQSHLLLKRPRYRTSDDNNVGVSECKYQFEISLLDYFCFFYGCQHFVFWILFPSLSLYAHNDRYVCIMYPDWCPDCGAGAGAPYPIKPTNPPQFFFFQLDIYRVAALTCTYEPVYTAAQWGGQYPHLYPHTHKTPSHPHLHADNK